MCDGCRYYFKGKVKKSRKVWDALQQCGNTVDYEEDAHKCGLNPTAVILEKNQPICSRYGKIV